MAKIQKNRQHTVEHNHKKTRGEAMCLLDFDDKGNVTSHSFHSYDEPMSAHTQSCYTVFVVMVQRTKW